MWPFEACTPTHTEKELRWGQQKRESGCGGSHSHTYTQWCTLITDTRILLWKLIKMMPHLNTHTQNKNTMNCCMAEEEKKGRKKEKKKAQDCSGVTFKPWFSYCTMGTWKCVYGLQKERKKKTTTKKTKKRNNHWTASPPMSAFPPPNLLQLMMHMYF